jgi:hypothetical protein
MKILLLLVSLLCIVGCTTTGQSYSPPPPAPQGKALVHFMRSSVTYGNFYPTIFSVNDVKIVSLYDYGYSWIHLDPGTYTFSAGTASNTDNVQLEIPIKSGQEYFIEYDQVRVEHEKYPHRIQKHRNRIRSIPPDTGKYHIVNYAYKKANNIEISNTAKQ